MSNDGERGRIGIEGTSQGGYCCGCGLHQVTSKRYSDGVITIECQNCGRSGAYRMESCGYEGCKTRFVPLETEE